MLHEKIVEEIGLIESKTLINIFNKLNERINWLDKFVTKIAVTYSCNCTSAMEVYDQMTTLIKRKKTILDVQDMIETAIEKLDAQEKSIIKYLIKYPQIHMRDLSEILNIGVRTLYRNLNNAYMHLSISFRPYILRINQFFSKEKWAAEFYYCTKQKFKNGFDYNDVLIKKEI